MRNNTQRIYERLSRGEFLSVDSADTSVRHLYEDIEENLEDYTEYFKEIGLQLESVICMRISRRIWKIIQNTSRKSVCNWNLVMVTSISQEWEKVNRR